MPRYETPLARIETLAGQKWVERFGCYSLLRKLGGFLSLSFSWKDGAYEIRVGGEVLPMKARDPEQAADIAVAMARVGLLNGLAAIADHKIACGSIDPVDARGTKVKLTLTALGLKS